MKVLAADKKSLVVGLGKTGLSCVDFLTRRGHQVIVADSRQDPPGLEQCRMRFPAVDIYCGAFDPDLFLSVDQLVVSPGVSLQEPAIIAARAKGVEVTGDVDIFSRHAKAPIVAITGSNGKSTVTSLVGEMARHAGIRVAVGGNLGVPALDLLDDTVELYVLELSSFQLETTERLGAAVATLLNLSEDHMDRYASYQDYYAAKQRIFRGCRHAVVNIDDLLSQPLVREGMQVTRFGLDYPDFDRFSTQRVEGELVLVNGFEPLIRADELNIKGLHNVSNALAALALGRAAGIPLAAMVAALRAFQGLPHRCELAGRIDGVEYINDSKGTNVGATLTAIKGFGEVAKGRIILLAGGEGKGQDFAALTDPVAKYVKQALLFGKDAPLIESHLTCPCQRVASLQDAVVAAQGHARPGDVVLLSPACASFDMFKNYEERGQVFVAAVNQLSGGAQG